MIHIDKLNQYKRNNNNPLSEKIDHKFERIFYTEDFEYHWKYLTEKTLPHGISHVSFSFEYEKKIMRTGKE